jgi:hypothetical protein
MNKITSYTLSISLLAVGMSMASCAKSTKRKVANEWKVASYLKTESNSNGGGGSNESKLTMTETSFTSDNTSTSNGNTTSSHSEGTVNSHVIEIKKDGTWIWTQDASYTGNNNNSARTVTEQSGTWSFVGKTKGDDFKKNERILLNILTKKVTSSQISNQVVVSESTTNETFLTGENVQIYTINESKNKEMELEFTEDIASTSGNSVNTTKTSINMTLKQK